MYLILRKVDALAPDYSYCYRFNTLEEAQAKYQELLVDYSPRCLDLVQTNSAQLAIYIHEDGNIDVSPLEFPLATHVSPGIIQLATALEANYENPQDYTEGIPVSVSPTLIKEMIDAGIASSGINVPNATTTTAGKVRLATEEESDYTDPSNGEDHIAVMQPVATKDMIDTAAQYTTEYAQDVTNIKQALDNIYAQMNYLPLKINSFSADKTIFEEGSTHSVDLLWTYNKELTSDMSQSINGNLIAYNLRQDTLQNVNSTQNVTLSATDGTTNVSRTITLSFTKCIYWGEAVLTSGADLTSLFVMSLRKSVLQNNYKGTYDFNLSTNDLYGYIACPDSYNMPGMCLINNWLTELIDCGTINFISDYGITTVYRIYRTAYPGLGAFDMVFS